MSERRILWAEVTSPELRASADGGIAILPIGSTEQHGRHLPVGTDTRLASEIARRAAARVGDHRNVVVLPGLWISLAEHHMGFAGTLTLDFKTFMAVLRCTVGSLKRQGFRKVLLLNGHGGNVAALTIIVDELTRDLALPIAAATYWVVAGAAFAKILDGQPNLRHACEAETSMMLALDPALTNLEEARSSEAPVEGFVEQDGFYRFRHMEHWSETGAVGTPHLADAVKGERLLEAAADAIARRLLDDTTWSEFLAASQNQFCGVR